MDLGISEAAQVDRSLLLSSPEEHLAAGRAAPAMRGLRGVLDCCGLSGQHEGSDALEIRAKQGFASGRSGTSQICKAGVGLR